jgi:hypothetical protein
MSQDHLFLLSAAKFEAFSQPYCWEKGAISSAAQSLSNEAMGGIPRQD